MTMKKYYSLVLLLICSQGFAAEPKKKTGGMSFVQERKASPGSSSSAQNSAGSKNSSSQAEHAHSASAGWPPKHLKHLLPPQDTGVPEVFKEKIKKAEEARKHRPGSQ